MFVELKRVIGINQSTGGILVNKGTVEFDQVALPSGDIVDVLTALDSQGNERIFAVSAVTSLVLDGKGC